MVIDRPVKLARLWVARQACWSRGESFTHLGFYL